LQRLIAQQLYNEADKKRMRAPRDLGAGKKTREKYPSLTRGTGDTKSASDHAAVWADFDLEEFRLLKRCGSR